jgi:DNA-binding response OmpR family regulator
MEDLTILIVENESLVALELAETIKSFGYKRVYYATNSKSAKELFNSKSFNLILMDINLEEKIDGVELYKSFDSDALVIFITAYKDEETISKAIKTEPLGYLVKPYSEDELKALLLMAKFKLTKKETKEIKREKISLGDGYYFDMEEEKLFFEDFFIHLGKKELKLLKLLILAKGNFVSYYTIEQEVWEGEIVSSSALRTLIYRLRCKLKYTLIESQPSYGIRLIKS